MLTPSGSIDLASSLKALSHPLRLRIIDLLDKSSLSAGDIAQSLDLSPRSVRQHLGILEKAAVVSHFSVNGHTRYVMDRQHAASVNSRYFALLGRVATLQPRYARSSSARSSSDGPVLVSPQPPPESCMQCQNNEYVYGLLEQLREMLDESQRDQELLRGLSSQVLTAQEEERKRVARELHDDTAQALTLLLVRMRLLERARHGDMSHDDKFHEGIAELRDITASALDNVRHIILDLRPSSLDDLGLSAALATYIGRFMDRWPLQVQFITQGAEVRPPADIALVLYRVVQEALTNIAKHAGASRATVKLVNSAGKVTIEIADNGRGFDAESTMRSKNRGLGLFGMSERMSLVGGKMEIESHHGQGTVVRAEVPLNAGMQTSQPLKVNTN